MNFITFHSLGNVISPTDELTPSFFRGVGQPPTRYDFMTGMTGMLYGIG